MDGIRLQDSVTVLVAVMLFFRLLSFAGLKLVDQKPVRADPTV
jgi:hypothetical protein